MLLEVLAREEHHLCSTSERLFAEHVDTAWVLALDQRPEIAERLDAFVARFSRFQDMLGERLVPAVLRRLLEPVGAIWTTSTGWSSLVCSNRSRRGWRRVICATA